MESITTHPFGVESLGNRKMIGDDPVTAVKRSIALPCSGSVPSAMVLKLSTPA